MKKSLKSTPILLMVLLCVSQFVVGQGISKKREYSGFFDSFYYRGPLAITVGGGTAIYKGEISKGGLGGPGIDINLGANYKIWPRIIVGLEFNYLTLGGKTGTADSIGTSFVGSDWGINLYGRYYLIDDIIRKAKDRRSNQKVKPYITIGLGFIKYKAALSPFGASSGLTPVFPGGLGIEFKISPKLQIIPEVTYNYTLSDKLDASSVKKGKDAYILAGLKIQYSPFAPKKKMKFTSSPAEPNQNREEHQEWRKKKDVPKPPPEEPLPGDENNEENTDENTEENPNENIGDTLPAEENIGE